MVHNYRLYSVLPKSAKSKSGFLQNKCIRQRHDFRHFLLVTQPNSMGQSNPKSIFIKFEIVTELGDWDRTPKVKLDKMPPLAASNFFLIPTYEGSLHLDLFLSRNFLN